MLCSLIIFHKDFETEMVSNCIVFNWLQWHKNRLVNVLHEIKDLFRETEQTKELAIDMIITSRISYWQQKTLEMLMGMDSASLLYLAGSLSGK